MTYPSTPDATVQDGVYPRPQLVRAEWRSLDGEWEFARDDRMSGSIATMEFDRTINVPFPPESPASGINDTSFTPCVWYRRTFGADELAAAGYGGKRDRVLLHFGAVDHSASVWVNDQLVAQHEGGQSPFTADLTGVLDPGRENVVIVRAIDIPDDVSVLKGKQDWREHPHAIWYHRTTGIWQPVWLECVPSLSIEHLSWRADLASAGVDVDVELAGPVGADVWVAVRLSHDGETLAEGRVRTLGERTSTVRLVIASQRHGQQYEELLWRPERPNLLRAEVVLENGDATPIDAVGSYLGLREVGIFQDRFLLNDRPMKLRAVLAQNYWPETHLAATPEALRREVELILELGFNAARVHQKAEDPRFLYWADRLGLMIWAETANAYAFDHRAIGALVSEWSALVKRTQSHPSIVAWVPLNESWGVPHLARDPRQAAFSRSIADLTRALDGTRPVISNDGWEHTVSDIWSIHDYEADPAVLADRYSDPGRVRAMMTGYGPVGRRMSIGGAVQDGPIMLTEFGGVSLQTDQAGTWGYSSAQDPEDFDDRVTAILRAADGAGGISGFCYTQLTDTGQETNGLLYADRTPKVPVEHIRAAVRGS